MMKTVKLTALASLMLGLACHEATFAQGGAEPTPRQVFVSFIAGVPVDQVKFAPQNPHTDEPAPQTFNNILPPLPPDTVDALPQLRKKTLSLKGIVEGDKANPLVNEPRVNEPVESQNTDTVKLSPDKTPLTTLLPFYAHADEYLKARGASKVDQVVLDYEVTPVNPVLGLSANPKSVRLVIGPDFAAVTREGKTRIFDFKMRRLLTERSSEKGVIFDNISLFPIALKNIETIKSATQNGTRTQIPVGPDKTLEAFWMEASLGWSARTDVDGLSIVSDGTSFKASYDIKPAAEIKLEGPVLLSEDFRSSLFAFLHHDVAIHPIALKALGLPVSAPSHMNLMSFSPNYPDGLKTVWELTRSETVTRVFPLSPDAKAAISTGAGSPIEFVIYNDRHGKAKPEVETHNVLREAIHQAQVQGDTLTAWMRAKDLEDRLGSCKADLALLCTDIEALEASANAQTELGRLIWAMKPHKSKALKATALGVLLKYKTENNAPAFLLKKAGMIRARLKTKDLSDPALKATRADRLLEEALAKNPTDPEVYRSLSQVYAVQRRYVESWNLQDALRRMPDVPESLTAPINRVEMALEKQAPAFFIPQFQ